MVVINERNKSCSIDMDHCRWVNQCAMAVG